MGWHLGHVGNMTSADQMVTPLEVCTREEQREFIRLLDSEGEEPTGVSSPNEEALQDSVCVALTGVSMVPEED